jgi:hypothetical protein
MTSPFDPLGLASAWTEYATDAAQRTALFWDVMRERGNQWREHQAQKAPNVLEFPFEIVMTGLDLPRHVNYGLVRIPAPAATPTDPKKRPFIVVDPRAGHGPGIGGFKPDSEIGAALANGHATYFIGFTPDPMPGQTLDDVFRAVVAFVRKVRALHPESEGLPVVIGNCQAGWMVMIAASLAPDDFGPMLLAGAPLSYWAGQRGKNPMRYSGGLLGGSWLTALSGDLGDGIFDGANLVANFEGLDPANTYWKKPYHLYANVDTEGARYLGFEKWWGAHVRLAAPEMQWIVDNLFVGNRLTAGRAALSDGTAIDLRTVHGPTVVLCSKGDNITPPAQALGWITDLYRDEQELIACGRTIVYAVHEKIGHLGIFVSGTVARKEHAEFASTIALIDVLPPGLYEMVLTPKAALANPDLADGEFVARFEPRGFEALGQYADHQAEDEDLFATVARVSEINLGLYRTLAEPLVDASVTPSFAEAARRLNPQTSVYASLHDGTLAASVIHAAADQARAARRPVSPDNPFLVLEQRMSEAIAGALDGWRDLSNFWSEQIFLATYRNPLLQAAVGAGGGDARRVLHPAAHHAEASAQAAAVRARLDEGGLLAAGFRALFYVAGHEGADERSFAVLRTLREEHPKADMNLAAFKALVREQITALRLFPKEALAAIPAMLPKESAARKQALASMRAVLGARGDLDEGAKKRLAEVEQLFGGPFAANDARRAAAGA